MTPRAITTAPARYGPARWWVAAALCALVCAPLAALASDPVQRRPQQSKRPDAPHASTAARDSAGTLRQGEAPGQLNLRWMVDAANERAALPAPADQCAAAPLISGPGLFPFDLAGATTDGLAHNACASLGSAQTYHDRWWRWQATASGFVALRTCLLTTIDTRITVYSDGACPPTDAQLLGCDNDACGPQSEVGFFAVAGETYLFRIGSYGSAPLVGDTSGALMIEMDTAPSDDCVNATAISGGGLFPFDNSVANTDGLPHPRCGPQGNAQIDHDIWWRWSASSSGPVMVSATGADDAEFLVAVYEPGAPCPPPTTSIISQSDDGGCDGRTDQVFVAVAGQEYLIRVGAPGGGDGAAGQLSVTIVQPFLCVLDVCQDLVVAPAFYSGGTAYRVAENWVAAASGSVSTICFWGAYNVATPASPPPDNFRITYYRNLNNRPGSVIATFTGAQLRIVSRLDMGAKIDGIYNIFEYSACHAPVPVADNQTYWVEVTNNIGVRVWAWAISPDGDQRCFQDESPGDSTYSNAIARNRDLAMCVGLDAGCPIDTNKDGAINFADLNNIIPHINTVCP